MASGLSKNWPLAMAQGLSTVLQTGLKSHLADRHHAFVARRTYEFSCLGSALNDRSEDLLPDSTMSSGHLAYKCLEPFDSTLQFRAEESYAAQTLLFPCKNLSYKLCLDIKRSNIKAFTAKMVDLLMPRIHDYPMCESHLPTARTRIGIKALEHSTVTECVFDCLGRSH